MATIKDVARAAGVSIATVSYVMNNDPRIKKETAEKVLKASEEMNYVASGIARSLKKNCTNNILVLTPDFGGPIFQEILSNIHIELKKRNYRMIVSNGDLASELLNERQTDGLINLDPSVSPELLSKIAKTGFVIFDTRKVYKPDDKVVVSRMDSYTPTYELVKMMIRNNCRKIGFMHGSIDSPDNIKRYNGFVDALKEEGLEPFCILHGEFLEKGGYDAMNDYLTNHNQLPDALFCANDEMAIGVINCLNDRKIKIPEQIKVAGFDNIQLGKYCKPSLTTIDINRADWSKNIANSIVDKIEDPGKEIENYNPHYEIIRRESF